MVDSDTLPKERQCTELKYTAAAAGRVFLYDVMQDQTVGRYQVRPGQTLIVDANSARATLDGNEILVGDIKLKTNYKIYFMPK